MESQRVGHDWAAFTFTSLSPALTGRFFTTEPLAKPDQLYMLNQIGQQWHSSKYIQERWVLMFTEDTDKNARSSLIQKAPDWQQLWGQPQNKRNYCGVSTAWASWHTLTLTRASQMCWRARARHQDSTRNGSFRWSLRTGKANYMARGQWVPPMDCINWEGTGVWGLLETSSIMIWVAVTQVST